MEPQATEDWQTNCAPLPPRGEGEENHACPYDTITAPPPLGKLNAPTRLRRGRVQFANRRVFMVDLKNRVTHIDKADATRIYFAALIARDAPIV
jgi:hypothetical protein